MFDKPRASTNADTDDLHDSMRRLSDDVGRMADRIGDMADRIGDMADRIGDMSERILETQRIQGENLNQMQTSMNAAMGLLTEEMKANRALLERLLRAGKDVDLPL